MTIDSFYTSAELADTLILLANAIEAPRVVADFACGEGSLLLAAERRWRGVSVIANDISRPVVRKLKAVHPTWAFSSANFLEPSSIRSSRITAATGLVDLIVLNPPFSRRDKKTYLVELNGARYRVSVATAFVINSLRFMSDKGTLLAVLPDGCLVSTTDASAWGEIQRAFNFELIRDNARSAFHGVSARTCLIRISKIIGPKRQAKNNRTADITPFTILRGSCQMHSRGTREMQCSASLVHTSNLTGGKVMQSGETVSGNILKGPALLFPRVGRVTPEKVCLLESDRLVVLSDCVLAITCPSLSALLDLRCKIITDWSSFATSYRGTGAPYITIERATRVLGEIMVTYNTKQSEEALAQQDKLLLA